MTGTISMTSTAPSTEAASTQQNATDKTRLLDSWRYAGGKRDLRLDLLRGFAALTMIIDHVGGKDSLLYTISGGDRFFVSAAEGFVFISGLVMGIVYAGLIARKGLRAAMAKGAKRVGTLYALTVILGLVFAALSLQAGASWAPKLQPEEFLDFAASVLTFHRTVYLTDVLLLYTLVVAAALPALALMRRGFGWLVLAGSWSLWAAWQWWPDSVQIPWRVADGNTFHFASWQVLFITGLVIGYYHKSRENNPARLPARLLRDRVRVPVQLAALLVSTLIVGGSIAFYLWYQANPGTLISASDLAQIFGKPDVRLGRLALFGCIFACFFLLTTFAWTPIKKLFGWLLLPMGQDALTVYTLHLFAILLATQVTPEILGSGPYSKLDNTLIQVTAIAALWAIIVLKRPAAMFVTNASTRFGAWLSARLGITRVVVPHRSGRLRILRPLLTAAACLVVVAVTTGPIFAEAIKRNANAPAGKVAGPDGIGIGTTSAAARALSAPSQTAEALPTGVAQAVPQQTPDFGMLVSGTAIPTGPIPTPTQTILKDYVEKHTFNAPTLNRSMPYYIYLPPSYEANPEKRYPVVYMLHGISGTYNEWMNYGLLGRARDAMLAGQLSEFIIVLPQGDQGYWVDHAGNGPKWDTYVVHDVVSEIDTHFRTLADREHRAIGGLSMGGYGALHIAINNPDVFGVAGAHSPSMHTFQTAPPFYGTQAYFDAHDPIYLYKAHPDTARTLKLWIDDGQQDSWLPVVTAFHQSLVDAGIPSDFHVYPGAHEGDYWSTHVLEYLQFYSSALSVPVAPTATPTWTPTVVVSPPFAIPTPIGAGSGEAETRD